VLPQEKNSILRHGSEDRRSRGGISGLLAIAVVALACTVVACGNAESSAQHRPTVLVVGDSLVAAAAEDLVDYTPSGVDTVVLAGLGASPCDLWHGYREPRTFGGKHLAFKATVDVDRPKVVVFAFTGNPGTSKNACVPRSSTAYNLSEIVSRYRQSLTSMGDFAARMGARVILSATPARNPNVPEGWVNHNQHGYNGDPAFNIMMFELGVEKHWTVDIQAAAAISGAGLGWTLYL
jgi:hypothetical protein